MSTDNEIIKCSDLLEMLCDERGIKLWEERQ
jgi:hypothetical protein